MSTQCAREGAGVHCGLTMETLPDRVPVENYPWKTTRTRYPKKMLPDSALVVCMTGTFVCMTGMFVCMTGMFVCMTGMFVCMTGLVVQGSSQRGRGGGG